MIKLLFTFVCALMLSGCLWTVKQVTRIDTVTVYKPVYTPPNTVDQLPILVRPTLPIQDITSDTRQYYIDNPGILTKKLLESMAELDAYIEQLESHNAVYRKVLTVPSDVIPDPVKSTTYVDSQ